MKTITIRIFVISLSLFFTLNAFGQNWEWVRSSGGTANDEAELAAVDPQGNVIICGKFSDTAWFGTSFLVSAGLLDVFLAKYDALGTFLWARKASTSLEAQGLSVAADDIGNIAVTGHFKGTLSFGSLNLTGDATVQNFFIAVYDSSGTLKWADKAVGGAIQGKGVEFDHAGNVLVTGHYTDSAVFSSTLSLPNQGLQNAFLAKYSASGTLLWASHGGGQYNAWASSVGADSEGNSYITGAFRDTCWFGQHQIVSYGVNDIFLAKCSPTGLWLWARNAGGSSDDYGNGIEVDVFGHVAITGSFFLTVDFPPAPSITSYGAKDGFVAYYTPEGNCLWARAFGGTGEDKGIGVSTDVAGNVYVTGFIKNSGNFGSILKTCAGGDDVCLAKYNRAGSVLWADLAGGTSPDYGKGLQVYKQGVVYVAGYYEGTAAFSASNVTSKGNRESYVARYFDGSPMISTQPLSHNLCVGDMLQLAISIVMPGAYTYAWYKDSVLLPAFTSSSLSLFCDTSLKSGKYYCVVGNTFGATVSDTAHLIVNSLPVSALPDSPAYVLVFCIDSVTIDAGQGFISYLWETGDTTQCITYLGLDLVQYLISKSASNGYINVIVSDSNGCSSIDSVEVFVVYGLENIEASSISVFPNPTSDFVQIVSSQPLLAAELYSVSGQKLHVYPEVKSLTHFKISFNNLKAGLYMLRITSLHGTETKMLMVR